jgi:hypothetical protein
MLNIHNNVINKSLVLLSIKINEPTSTYRNSRVAEVIITTGTTQHRKEPKFFRLQHRIPQATMNPGFLPSQDDFLLTQYTDPEPSVSTQYEQSQREQYQCEHYNYMQLVGAPGFPVPTLSNSDLSQSFCQPIQQNFQCSLPPNYLGYLVVYPARLEEQSLAYATSYQHPHLFSPYTSSPVIWQDLPVDFFSAGLEGYGPTSITPETPYLPYIYTNIVGGGSYGAMSSRSGTYVSGWNHSEGIIHKPTGQRRGKNPQKKIRTTPSSCDKTGIRSMHCSPSERIQCSIELLGVECVQSFARIEHLRRHIKSVHSGFSVSCKVPRCTKSFSRSDNLYDHYYTHIDVEKPGRNRRLSVYELGQILGSQDGSIFRILQRKMERPRRPTRRRRR